jgi:hypothetical protein
MKFIFFLSVLFLSSLLYSQTGIIRGSVFDKANGESLPGVKVFVEGAGKGAYTDLDGKFEIKIEPGTYTLTFSLFTYANTTISKIIVSEDKVTIVDNIRLCSNNRHWLFSNFTI